MPRIALIGAGSVEFTRSVLADLFTFPELQGSLEVALHDIDQERLRTAEAVAHRMNEHTGAGAKVEAHLDRRAALDGVDYAINEIQVGGYQATVTDFDVPRRYGLRQTIGDTIGIGGILRGVRTIPVVNSIASDMHQLCPDAYLLNYTNPMAMVPWGVWAGTPFRGMIGVCHSVRDTHAHLATLLGIPLQDIIFETAGLNHQAWVIRFERNGEDLYPRLHEVLDADPEAGRRARVDIFRRFGRFVTESSEHNAEYVPWYMRDDGEILRLRIFVDDYLYRSQENLREYEEIKRAIDDGDDLPIEPGSELASEIVHSVETGTPREVYVNVRNEGRIAGYPEDACVEVPATVDANGVHPRPVGEVPLGCRALNRTFLNVAELTVHAVIEGRRELVHQAALLDPNAAATLTVGTIHDMVDELLAAHGELVPEALRPS
jgi:alpha-galactosidase